MADTDKNEKDRGSNDRNAASESDPKSGQADDEDSDEGELSPITPKTGEPSDNLRRRSEWFQKRHGGG